jgi:filamentous hemagglutinin family protein
MWRSAQRILLATGALVPLGLAFATANPLGGQVAGGSATISGTGTSAVTVTQSSQNAVINWNSFNIGNGELTKFVQPNSASTVLNRVVGDLGPSQIYGTLSANGRVFLINPNGLVVGNGAVINTAGFLATTHDIANADFMAGRYNFNISGRPDASIVNMGTITAANGGFAALVAPGVRNSGTISANFGKVGLAAGNSFALDLYGDKLIKLAVDDSVGAAVKDVATGQTLKSLVQNDGKLQANGGRVELTAAAARQVVDSAVNNTGVIEARSVGRRDGKIVLGAATRGAKPAGAPTQAVRVSGKLDVASKKGKGGTISVSGEAIELAAATLDASGATGGGKVLIGGDTGGGNAADAVASLAQAKLESEALPTASSVTIDSATTINASAENSGHGGKVVVWSDVDTNFSGTIAARGGASGGDGGFVEVSGKQALTFNGAVNTGAPHGANGTLLLDPTNVTIGSGPGYVVSVAALQNALASGNVVVTTGAAGSDPGDITITQSFGWDNNSLLALFASRNIIVNDGVTITPSGAHGFLALAAGVRVATSSFGGGFPDAAAFSGTGTGSVIFNGSAKIDLSRGTSWAAAFYNPPGGYTQPVDFSGHIVSGALGGGANVVRGPAAEVGVNSGVVLGSRFLSFMLVNNVTDLQNIGQNLAGRYALVGNIDASNTATWNQGAGFIPIGNDQTPFTGGLVGIGSSIDGLTINSPLPFVGLFGATGLGSYVANLHLTNASVTGNSSTALGFIAGVNGGLVLNVGAIGTISGTGSGKGIVGINNGIVGDLPLPLPPIHTVFGPLDIAPSPPTEQLYFINLADLPTIPTAGTPPSVLPAYAALLQSAISPPSTGATGGQPGQPGFVPPPLPLRTVVGPDGENRSSVPPPGETRFKADQVLLQVKLDLPPEQLTQILQELGLQVMASQNLTSLGRAVLQLRITDGRSVADIIRALEAKSIVAVAAPNHNFLLSQPTQGITRGDPAQYVLSKFSLMQAHQVASGKDVTIAVIDSEVDKKHTEIEGAISEELDTLGVKEPPHAHGTAMAGAIVSRDRLLGVAPGAKILAVRAFGESTSAPEGTSFNILRGIEWAVSQGARVINMSFAGPRDPSLERAFKAARDQGVVLVAAAGNAGPKSPALYPAADPSVIAVTAVDSQDRVFRGATHGAQVSVSAPGVDILAPAPDEAYQMTTGTSIATAHVSGVVALMLERDASLTPAEVRKILEATATDLGPKGKDKQFGWGLVNPQKALEAVAARRKTSQVLPAGR